MPTRPTATVIRCSPRRKRNTAMIAAVAKASSAPATIPQKMKADKEQEKRQPTVNSVANNSILLRHGSQSCLIAEKFCTNHQDYTARVRPAMRGLGTHKEKGEAPNLKVQHFPCKWSCRESNPGPLALIQYFSGCSSSVAFLGPGARTNASPTGSVVQKSRTHLTTRQIQQVP